MSDWTLAGCRRRRTAPHFGTRQFPAAPTASPADRLCGVRTGRTCIRRFCTCLKLKFALIIPPPICKRGAQGARGVRTVAEVTSSLTAVGSPLLAYLDHTPSAIRKVTTFWPSGRAAVWTYGRQAMLSFIPTKPSKSLDQAEGLFPWMSATCPRLRP